MGAILSALGLDDDENTTPTYAIDLREFYVNDKTHRDSWFQAPEEMSLAQLVEEDEGSIVRRYYFSDPNYEYQLHSHGHASIEKYVRGGYLRRGANGHFKLYTVVEFTPEAFENHIKGLEAVREARALNPEKPRGSVVKAEGA